MRNLQEFENRLSPALRDQFRALASPTLIQAYLDELPYIAEELDRSPLRLMTDRQGHCLDGGIFAALALSRLGHRPLLLDLAPAPGLDDDHVLALYSINGLWGCVAKSNYPVLRAREPVYRSLRELAMSYFDFYFNTEKIKSLRGYTRPLDLRRFPPDWMWDEAGIAAVAKRLYSLKPVPLISPGSAARLTPGDERTYRAASLGTDFSWAFGIRGNE
ncbi:MAG: hypothetical protein HY781_12595 [Chloroflexi bacterium]|nr:hypothetical protein [Chloroflexota bacterium]